MIYIIKYILLIHVQYQKFMGTVIAYKNEKNYKEAHTMFAKIATSYHVHNSYSLTFPGYQFCCRDINITSHNFHSFCFEYLFKYDIKSFSRHVNLNENLEKMNIHLL